MSAVAVALREAEALGVGFRLEHGRIRFINGELLSQEDLTELWRQRAELRRLLEDRALSESARLASLLPDPYTAPMGKCEVCQFIAPLNTHGRCGACVGKSALGAAP